MSEDSNNLEPFLPAEKLCNSEPTKKPNPIFGDGALGNEEKGKMYYAGSDKKKLVETIQRMLKTLDHDCDLGSSGPNKDGIDGVFGERTENAVTDFQRKNKDWDGKQLKDDGLVGPKTSDALNRAMVGKSYESKKWDDHYPTPKKLVKDKPYHTVTSDFLVAKGLEIEPGQAKNGRVFIVGLILQICLIKDINNPLQNAKYHLEVGNRYFEGMTTDDGILSHPIPSEAKTGKLILDTITFDLIIENIEPVDTDKGAEVRLKNLGFFPSNLDEVQRSGEAEQGEENNGKEHLRIALIRFQKASGIDATGELNDATKKKLEEVYGG